MKQYNWMENLTDREKKEVLFASLYTTDFGHGTDGHHRLNLIARLANILMEYEEILNGLQEHSE